MFKLLYFVLLVSFVNGELSLGSAFHPCKAEDSQCIQDVSNTMVPIFAGGIPEYKVEVLDPFNIKEVNASAGSLYFVVTDVTVKGLKDAKILKAVRDVDKSKLYLTISCTATLEGQYDLKGSVLVVPLEGKGRIFVDMKSALFELDIDMVEKVGDDGIKHWSAKTFSHTFDLKEKSNVVFENLYDGNEVLGQAARDLIENNGNDIIKEIGGPVIKYVITRVVKNINRFFKAVALSDLSLDV